MRALPLLLLASVLGLALYLRELQTEARSMPSGERSVGGARWLIDDPDAAYHLRRIALALENGEVPQFDRFLSHPSGSAVPWPPLFDGLLARFAGLALGERAARDEARLEALLVHVPPVLGVLAAAAVFLATVCLCAGPPRTRLLAGCLAALVYAVAPIAVWYGAVTRVDHHVFAGLCLALYLAALARAVQSDDLGEASLCAAAAGVVSAVLALAWLPGILFSALGASAFLARALGRDERSAALGARGGLLCFLVAAALTLVPAAGSPWNEVAPRSLTELTETLPTALAVMALPFAALWLRPLRSARRAARALAAALAGALALALVPAIVTGARQGLRWLLRSDPFMDVVAESRTLVAGGVGATLERVMADLTPLALVFPLAWLLLLRRARQPARLALVLLAATLTAMALIQRRFGNGLAVPLGITLAVALHDGWLRASPARRPAWLAAGVAAALLALAALFTGGARSADELRDEREWRAELIGGLRWMRSGTPAPGPWNRPEAPQAWGVLSAWGLGHLIEYHARRPTIATNFGSFVGQAGLEQGARALLSPRPEDLASAMHRLGAAYVVVTPRQAGDLVATARIAGLALERRREFFERGPGGKRFGERARETALFRLALTPVDAPPDHYPGLARVFAARRRETVCGAPPGPGEASGPVISVYRLVRERDSAAPQLESR